jgi:hypothetical protein
MLPSFPCPPHRARLAPQRSRGVCGMRQGGLSAGGAKWHIPIGCAI